MGTVTVLNDRRFTEAAQPNNAFEGGRSQAALCLVVRAVQRER